MDKLINVIGFNMMAKSYNCNCEKCARKNVNICDCGSCKTVEKKKRRMWVRPYYTDRNNSGAFQTVFSSLFTTDPSLFHSYMRMSQSLLEELLLIVGPSIQKYIF